METTTLISIVVAMGLLYLAYRLGEKRGEKGINKMKGGKKVTLSNGRRVLLSLDNEEENIFDCYMNLKQSKVELELQYEKAKGKLLKLPKEIREKYEI